jgi:hypothetical protein
MQLGGVVKREPPMMRSFRLLALTASGLLHDSALTANR